MELKRLSNTLYDDIGSTTNKRRRASRKEILEKKKAIVAVINAAVAEKDPLASFPAFSRYREDDLSVYLEAGRGDELSHYLKKYIQNLLKVNMEGAYGSEWTVEEKIKRREMVACEARYIFVYEALTANSCASSTTSEVKRSFSNCQADRGPLVGFVHYRFTIEEELPVLYVYELQLESRVRGKGLGKFLMQLIELIAQKSCMGAVLLTVQKANLGAMNFYMSKLRYLVSTISPSRVDPLMGNQKSYEILCKTFDCEANAIFANENMKNDIAGLSFRTLISHGKLAGKPIPGLFLIHAVAQQFLQRKRYQKNVDYNGETYDQILQRDNPLNYNDIQKIYLRGPNLALVS